MYNPGCLHFHCQALQRERVREIFQFNKLVHLLSGYGACDYFWSAAGCIMIMGCTLLLLSLAGLVTVF